jgi:hypothetical protein
MLQHEARKINSKIKATAKFGILAKKREHEGSCLYYSRQHLPESLILRCYISPGYTVDHPTQHCAWLMSYRYWFVPK